MTLENVRSDDGGLTPEPCSCGQRHVARTEVLLADGAVRELPRIVLGEAGTKGAVLVVCDPNTRAVAGDDVAHMLASAGFAVRQTVLPSPRPHTDETAIAYVEAAGPKDFAILVSVGSGTVTDVVRMVTHRAGKPFVAVPTAASMDGYTSPVVPMFNNGLKQAVPATPPVAVVGDLDLVATAPPHMAMAGFGDLVGKLTARFDWTLAHLLTGEYFCGPTADLSRKALDRACADPGGFTAGRHDALRALMDGLLFAGLAMQMVGTSRPASGAEHHLGHYWEEQALIAGADHDLHGTYVGVATSIAAALMHRLLAMEPQELRVRACRAEAGGGEPVPNFDQWESIRRKLDGLVPAPATIRALLAEAGAPVTPRDLGLTFEDVRLGLLHAHERRPRFTSFTLAAQLGLLHEWAGEIAEEYA